MKKEVIQKQPSAERHSVHKRTELAHERTFLAYIRTAASLILFGLVFIGFKEQAKMFIFIGYIAVAIGVIFLIVAFERLFKHQREIEKIRKLLKIKKFKKD